MANRFDRGFRFPLQKYSDEKALYTNFRYIQEYLNYIRKFQLRAATVIAAAPDSSERARNGADVTVGSTNAETDLASAIAKVGSDFDLYLHEGTYNFGGELNLGGGSVLVRGQGTIDAGSTSSNILTCSGPQFIVQGLEFTGGASGAHLIVDGKSTNGLFVVSDCRFHDITARACVRPSHTGSGGAYNASVLNCEFRDIALAGGGGATAEGVIYSDQSSAGQRQWHVYGNTFEAVTGDACVNANGGSTKIMCWGNHIVDGSAKGDGTWFHNFLNGTYDAGDHTSVDHGSLSGLTDDDHTQYVLRTVLTSEGDIAYRNGSDWTRLAVGTAGQILQVNSGATAPEWAAAPGGAAFSEFLLIGA